MSTMNTDQPMPLEEVKAGLTELRMYFERNEHFKDELLVRSALHHLEAGKRDTERLDTVQRNGANVQYCGGYFILTVNGGARFITGDLRAAIDGAYPSTTPIPQ